MLENLRAHLGLKYKNPGLDDRSLLSSSPIGSDKEWSWLSVVTYKINVNDTLCRRPDIPGTLNPAFHD